MGETLDDIARLEPAVRSAISLRGSTGASHPDARKQKDKDSPPGTRPCTRE